MKRSLLVLLIALFAGAAGAANVALFADNDYTDYNLGDPFSEASNMQAVMWSNGVNVTAFTGITSAEWSSALAGKSVLVIPEVYDLAADLPADTMAVIDSFCSGGGRIVLAGSGEAANFPNAVFGYALGLGSSGVSSVDTVAAAGTPFAGGPATLPDANAMYSFTAVSLPSGARAVYNNGTDSMVFTVAYGAGSVTFLGFDWYDARPVGVQDGGWNSALLSAVNNAPTVYVEPGSVAIPVPTLNPLALALLALLLGTAAMLHRRQS